MHACRRRFRALTTCLTTDNQNGVRRAHMEVRSLCCPECAAIQLTAMRRARLAFAARLRGKTWRKACRRGFLRASPS